MLGELGVLGAKPFGAGEEIRAKGAKDAKFKGIRMMRLEGSWWIGCVCSGQGTG